MRKLLWTLPMFLAACGNPSLSGVPLALPDPKYPVWESVRMLMDATGVTMTNAAAVGTEITNNNSRIYVDLTDFEQARGQFVSSLTSTVVNCRIEYSLNDGTDWVTLVPNWAASAVANTITKSAFATIPTEARTDVLLRALIVGDGVLDPIVRYISLDLKGEVEPIDQD